MIALSARAGRGKKSCSPLADSHGDKASRSGALIGSPSFVASDHGCETEARVVVPSSPWNPSAAELNQLVGQYFSSELETAYSVVFESGKIVVRHRRLDDVPLVPVEKDIFKSKNWMFARVEFERDDNGGLTRMRVTPSNERVRRLSFEAVEVSRSR
jgi:hypothetical protein